MRSLDEQLLRLARTRFHSSRLEETVGRFTRIGEHGGVWLATGLAGQALDRRHRSQWRRATATVAGASVLNSTIKLLVRRSRPELAGLPPLTGTPTRLSFPSSHACTSFAAALCFSRLGLPRTPLYALAGGLSASRVYLGVHYPSDVLAGALLGTALAARACAAVSPVPDAPL